MPTLTIKEKLKTLFEEHSLHKKYKEQDIVYLTIDGDIGFYQALRNIPRYIPITDDRWWRRLNKKEVDSITPTPTPEPDPDPTPTPDPEPDPDPDPDPDPEPTSTAKIYLSSNDSQYGIATIEDQEATDGYYTVNVGSTVTLKAIPITYQTHAFFKWQTSTDGTNWTDVANANDNYSITINSEGNYYYRAMFFEFVLARIGFNTDTAGASCSGKLVSTSPTIYEPFEQTENIITNYIEKIPNSGYPSITLECGPASGHTFVKWQKYDETNGWVDGNTSPQWTIDLESRTAGTNFYFRAVCN